MTERYLAITDEDMREAVDLLDDSVKTTKTGENDGDKTNNQKILEIAKDDTTDILPALKNFTVSLGKARVSAKAVLGKLGGKFTTGLNLGGFLTLFHYEFGVNVPDFKIVSDAAELLLEQFALNRIIQQEPRPRGKNGKDVEVWVLTDFGKKVVLALANLGDKPTTFNSSNAHDD